jgi:glyoxylase I family protein
MEAMDTAGLNHVILTISDVARSREFYGGLLGFEIADVPANPAAGFYFEVGGMTVWFIRSAKPIEGDRFSEFRIGLDHLGFAAPSKEALERLAEKLTAADVETSGVERFFTGNWYVAFRDPDNIQLEYWLA